MAKSQKQAQFCSRNTSYCVGCEFSNPTLSHYFSYICYSRSEFPLFMRPCRNIITKAKFCSCYEFSDQITYGASLIKLNLN